MSIRRRAIAPRLQDDPAVSRYLATGEYPIRGRSTHFNWDVWTRPERERTSNAEAERAVAFISSLTHSKGSAAGKPFRLRPWQERIVRQIFGTLGADGFRQYRTVFWFLPTRQGKTEIAAAIALFLLFGDGELGGELYSVAVDTDQATIVYNVARTMVQHDPELAARLEVIPSRRRILHHASNSAYKVLAADAPSALGVNASGVIMDELAAWPHREIYDVMSSRTGSRRAPLTAIITTAGSDEHGVGKEVYDYAVKVQSGVIVDLSFLPVLYEAPATADPWSESTWQACNPALGDFRSLEEFRIAARQAREVPGREASFRRLYLNQWITQQDQPWIALESWDACVAPARDLRGRRCFVGLDLSTTTDLTAMALLFPDDADEWDVRVEFWCPSDQLAARGRRSGVDYVLWARRGDLVATAGNVVDYAVIEARIHAVLREYNVQEVAVDPWNARGLVAKLQGDGVPAIEVGQTMANLSGAAKDFEKFVLSKRLRHDGNPVLRWNVSNVIIDTDANGNIRPSKRASGEKNKIDGVSAVITGLSRAIVQAPKASIYEVRGVVSF